MKMEPTAQEKRIAREIVYYRWTGCGDSLDELIEIIARALAKQRIKFRRK